MKKAIAALIVVVLVGGGLAAWWALYYNDSGPKVTFSLPDLQGNMHQASQWRGKVVLLNFWATWCKPCREEIPMLIKAQSDYGNKTFQIIGLAMDKPDPVRRFASEYHINYPLLVAMNKIAQLMDTLHAGAGLPASLLLDRQGHVHARIVGSMTRAQLDRLVAPLLDKTDDH